MLLKTHARFTVTRWEVEEKSVHIPSLGSINETRGLEDISPLDFIFALFEILAALIIGLILLFFLFIMAIIMLLGKIFILATSFYPENDLAGRIKTIMVAFRQVLDPLHLGFIADAFEYLAILFGSFDLSILAFNVADVTCVGTQAPIGLLMNLIVILLVTLLIGLDFFPFISITVNAYVQQMGESLKYKRVPSSVIFFLGFFGGIAEGFLRYVVQVLLSFMTYNQFFPTHAFTPACDENFSQMDSIIAYISTAILYACFLPTLHVILSVFIPGLPKDAHFQSAVICGCWENDAVIQKEEKELEMSSINARFGGEEGKRINRRKIARNQSVGDIEVADRLTIGHRMDLDTKLQRKDSTIFEAIELNKISQLPSFMTIVFLVFYDLTQCSFETLNTYFYCIGWKLKCLMKLTFGYWDDELLRGMQIYDKSQVFDEDADDELHHHDDMIRLKGKSHSLIWQFSSVMVILAKLSEAINESSLFIVPEKEKIKVHELCKTPPIDETKSKLDQFLLRMYYLFDGRIANLIFSMFGLIVALVLIFWPAASIILIFAIFMVPERCSRIAKKSAIDHEKFKHVMKIKRWILACKK